MLAVLTGPVRSGKSAAGLALALGSGLPVTMVVGGRADDEEMARRIDRHRADRGGAVSVLEADARLGWLDALPENGCVLVDCLGTVLGMALADLVPEDAIVASGDAEQAGESRARAICDRLLARTAPTVVVTNEVGWGVVPPTPVGRLFADVLGRANRMLVMRAACAWLVIGGKCLDLSALDEEVAWPR